MKRILAVATALIFSLNAHSQKADKAAPKDNSFRYPVLVKLIQGEGNIFRIGFVRYNDYNGIEENANDPKNIYANFMDLVNVSNGNFKDKWFVYFPLSKSNGEMLIIDRKDVTRLDMLYEQAMELIVVNGNQ